MSKLKLGTTVIITDEIDHHRFKMEEEVKIITVQPHVNIDDATPDLEEWNYEAENNNGDRWWIGKKEFKVKTES